MSETRGVASRGGPTDRHSLPTIAARPSTQPSVVHRHHTHSTSQGEELLGVGWAVDGNSQMQLHGLHGGVAQPLHVQLESLRASLEKKDEIYREDINKLWAEMSKKDENHRAEMQNHRAEMSKKDQTYLGLLAAQREDMKRKDELLERLMQQLSILNLPPAQPTPIQVPEGRTQFAPAPPLVQHTSPTTAKPVPPVRPSRNEDAPSSSTHDVRLNPSVTAPPAMNNLVTQLQAGGSEAEAALVSVLESALEVLEAVAMSTPRKQRKALKIQCEKVETVLEEVDGELVGRLTTCDRAEIIQLSEKLGSLHALQADEVGVECMRIVEEALAELKQCGDAVTGASRQLASRDVNVRVSGVETLRDLQRKVLEKPVAAEVAAAGLLLELATDEVRADLERATSLLALFALGLRNGEAAVDVLIKHQEQADGQLLEEVYEGRVQGQDGAVMLMYNIALHFLCHETATKSIAVRQPLEKACITALGNAVKASCPKVRYQELLPLLLDTAEDDDIVVAAAGVNATVWPVLSKTGKELAGVWLSCDPARLGWKVRRRVVEPGLPAGRWRELAQTLSVESVCTCIIGGSIATVCNFLPAIPHDGVWPEVIAEAVHLARVNCEATLSAQQCYSFYAIFGQAFQVLTRAARDPAHHLTLMPCAEALLWSSGNGFSFAGLDTAETAATACVSLLGRNEGGLTLDKQSVSAVLENVHRYFNTSPTADWITKAHVRQPAVKVTPKVKLVVDMVVADSNKLFVLEHPRALDDLVAALLLDEQNPRRTQDGADILQSTAALALENLALSDVGKAPLRAHTGVMKGLRALKQDAMSDAARRSASAALFELDEGARQKAKKAAAAAKAAQASGSSSDDDNNDVFEHVMLSYNWGHQEAVKRLNLALKARSYTVWIDIEKMQGSTVEAMSEAVEDAAVMCYGISQAYKESTNCRLEAQYAFQQQVDMVPLMMEQGYNAKGWLGMLLGVRLWYGFYGSVLESEAAFNGKVDELCRELGERGKT